MALMQKLVLRQGQSLVMTPQLQQAIKLLQMSNVEIQTFVDEEMERNPLLERAETPGESALKPVTNDDVPDAPFSGAEARGGDGDGAHSPSDGPTSEMRPAQAGPDPGWQSLRGTGGLSLDGEGQDFASTISRAETLGEHLTSQLNLNFRNPADLLIGQQLIGAVNDQGYLTLSPAVVAQTLGTNETDVLRVLQKLKTFDPVGVFGASLEECLALQLKERNRLDPAMDKLLAHLPLVAKRDYAALKSLCGVSLDDLHDMIAEIRSLNPKPGHAFGSDPIAPVIPDVSVRAAADGSWLIELNSETLPRVLINNSYAARISRNAKPEEKRFFVEAQAKASWLVKSLDQRARTILKVAGEIVKQQDAFLILGIAHLRPITLRMVAEAIEMHESTVSRVTSNKYMATPRGTFEMKYFFTTAIASSGPGIGDHSAESVRHRVRELIGAENSSFVLSDDDLVQMLRSEGVEIARRTVAKYRESLGILSSVQRRREARAKR